MYISFDTEDKFSDQDRRILAILAEPDTDTTEISTVAGPSATRTEEATPEPKPKRTRKSRSEKTQEPAQEPLPEEPEEPVTEEPAQEPLPEAESEGHTLSEAVEVATQLVSSGKAADVKKALSSVGVKRVGQIPADKVDEFLVALNA
jgi:outer membrane biosynthesis protein TonB